MSVKEKKTSDRIAHLAAIVLPKAGISMVEKELAGSMLPQVGRHAGRLPTRLAVSGPWRRRHAR
jgi:hypothetical protein